MWTKIVKEDLMHEPPRRVRETRADYLLYLILDHVADQLRPIAEAYADRLGYMHACPLRAFPVEWLEELDEMHLELVELARSIRPMKHVVNHLAKDYEDKICEERMCLDDVEDAIEQMVGDLKQLEEMGKSLEEAYEVHSDRQMNATLFNLSVVGAIFLPAQFITGIYGMNFTKQDGTPNQPELMWEDGYAFFWILTLGIISLGFGVALCAYFLHRRGLAVHELCQRCYRGCHCGRKRCCRKQRRSRR